MSQENISALNGDPIYPNSLINDDQKNEQLIGRDEAQFPGEITRPTHLSIIDGGRTEEEKPNELHHADYAYENLSSLWKWLVFTIFCSFPLFWIGGLSIIYSSWEPTQLNRGLSSSEVAFILSGQGLGSICSLLVTGFLLRKFSRRALWMILSSMIGTCFYGFAVLDIVFTKASIFSSVIYWLMFFAIGFGWGPVRSITLATISKFFPNNTTSMVQLYIQAFTIGNLLGPFMAGFLLPIIGLAGLNATFGSLIFLVSILGYLFLPKSQPNQKRDTVIHPWDLLKTWRGLSIVTNVFIGGCALRIQLNGLSLYLKNEFDLNTVQINHFINIVCFGGFSVFFVNFLLLRVFDYRLVYIIITLMAQGFGYLTVSGFLGFIKPTISMTMIGFFFSQFSTGCTGPENMDMNVVAQEILGHSENLIAVKDAVALLITLVFNISVFCGSALLGVFLEFIPYNYVAGGIGVIIICLALNFFFASKIFKSSFLVKRN